MNDDEKVPEVTARIPLRLAGAVAESQEDAEDE